MRGAELIGQTATPTAEAVTCMPPGIQGRSGTKLTVEGGVSRCLPVGSVFVSPSGLAPHATTETASLSAHSEANPSGREFRCVCNNSHHHNPNYNDRNNSKNSKSNSNSNGMQLLASQALRLYIRTISPSPAVYGGPSAGLRRTKRGGCFRSVSSAAIAGSFHKLKSNLQSESHNPRNMTLLHFKCPCEGSKLRSRDLFVRFGIVETCHVIVHGVPF